MSNSSESKDDIEDTDYFGLLAGKADPALVPELASDLGVPVESSPGPTIHTEPEPRPVSDLEPHPNPFPEVAPSAAQESTKKPFVANRRMVPTTADPAAAAATKPPASKPKQAKKKAPAAKSKQPKRQAEAAPAKNKTAAPSMAIGTTVKALLVITCVSIAVVGYSLWQHRGSPAHESTTVDGVAELQARVGELSVKIEKLEGIRELQRYGNEAIADGHRSARYKLDEYYKNPKIQELKAVANAEIIRVESYYVATRRFRAFEEEMPFIPEVDPVATLSQILLASDNNWSVRARAANLLSQHPKNALAAKALAEACHTDSNLYVVQEAILAFAKVTGFRSSGVFDSQSINRWWNENHSQFELP
ncbi:MAG: hypothetical protein ACI9NC_002643 [Verrucomicrobiales bacterium]|jgi:hypothetical protein